MAEGQSGASPGCRVDLTGQVALVTGTVAGHRPGDCRAARLVRSVGGVVARSLEGLQATLDAIRQKGGTAEGYAVNVADSAAVGRVVEEIEAKFQRIHVLVNNAGVTRDGLMLEWKTAPGKRSSIRI